MTKDKNKKREYKKRYREKHPEYYYAEKRKYYRKTAFNVNYKQRFSDEEIDMIINHEIPDSELSKKIGRSVQSIQIKRSRLRKEKGV